MIYRCVIWLWSALVTLACVAMAKGTVTFYPGAATWVNLAGAAILLAIAIGFALRKTWSIYAAIPVILGTTVIDVLLGLHGGVAVAWPGIVLGVVGWAALVSQYALRRKPAD